MPAPPRISRALLGRYSKLALKKVRSSERLFIVEGIRSVEEALASRWPLEALIVTPGFAERQEFGRLRTEGLALYTASEKELARIADTVSPQGIAAVARLRDVGENPLESAPSDAVAVALEGIADPGNLGTIIRTCDWFGASALILGGSPVEPYNPKVVRAAMGSLFRVPVVVEEDLPRRLSRLRSQGWRICAAVAEGGSAPPRGVSGRILLLLGSEAHGLSQEARAAADLEVTIPRFGNAESLNVAVAAGAMLALARLAAR